MPKPYTMGWYKSLLAATVGKEAMRDAATKKYIGQISQHAADAYKIGRADALANKLPTNLPPPPKTKSEITESAFAFVSNAYTAGYKIGEMERK